MYCLGPAVQLWGPTPATIEATAQLAPSGVDAATRAELTWPNGQVASITCSFIDDEAQHLVFVGTDGALTLDGDAHTGGLRATELIHTTSDGTTSTITVPPGDPYLAMVEAFAATISGATAWGRPIDDSIAVLELLERIAKTAAADTPEIDETPT